jgi:hypothetical protein
MLKKLIKTQNTTRVKERETERRRAAFALGVLISLYGVEKLASEAH